MTRAHGPTGRLQSGRLEIRVRFWAPTRSVGHGPLVARCYMKAEFSTGEALSTAASVAPEDLNRGDYVAVLTEIVELPSFLWHEAPESERNELVRLRCIPSGSGMPLKVKA